MLNTSCAIQAMVSFGLVGLPLATSAAVERHANILFHFPDVHDLYGN